MSRFDGKALELSRQAMELFFEPMPGVQLQAKLQNLFISAMEYAEPVTAATVPDGLASSVKCWCRSCRPVSFTDTRFVVCPECGNKRCPHANDHRNACTGSNEPGQEGSAYPAAPEQEV